MSAVSVWPGRIERRPAGTRNRLGCDRRGGRRGDRGLAALLFIAVLIGSSDSSVTDSLSLGLGTQLLRYLGIAAVFFSIGLVWRPASQYPRSLYIAVVSDHVLPLALCGALQRFRTLQPPISGSPSSGQSAASRSPGRGSGGAMASIALDIETSRLTWYMAGHAGRDTVLPFGRTIHERERIA